MSTSKVYRRVLGLLAGSALFVNGVLLSGCKPDSGQVGLEAEPGIPEAFPAVVLSVPKENIKKTDGKESVTFEFDWGEATLGGIPLKDIAGNYQRWRLNVFRFSDPERKRLAGGGSDCFLRKETMKTTLLNLPADVLLQADIDFDMIGPPKDGDKKCEESGGDNKKARALSFVILLHGPETLPEGR